MKDENISRDEIVEQLDRILGSDLFWRLRKASCFLRFVGWAILRDQRDQITPAVIAEEAFDEQLDDIRVQSIADQVRKALSEYYAPRASGYRDPILVSIPKGHFEVEFRNNPTSAHPETADGIVSRRWGIRDKMNAIPG